MLQHIKQFIQDKKIPSFSTFKRARLDKKFIDVTKRVTHFHCRCDDCSKLQNFLLRGWNTCTDQKEYKMALKQHNQEVRDWRRLEKEMQNTSKHQPEEVIVLSYDDTSCIKLPRYTNRSPKNIPLYKFCVVPFNIMNHGIGKNYYVYQVSKRYKKGGNRLTTTLFHFIRQIKWKKDEECSEQELLQKRAKKLVLMADNYGENKNNTIFAFCSHLVSVGWFTVVKLLFGPVGHTHNGNDAVHYVHNQIVGDFNSVGLVQYLKHFENGWTEHTRPTPVILDVQYDWDKLYEPVIDKLVGFTRTQADNSYVRALRFKKDARTGLVETHYKRAATDSGWLGEHKKRGQGFFVLKSKPPTPPKILPPTLGHASKKELKQLMNKKNKKHAESVGQLEDLYWLRQAAMKGTIPVLGDVRLPEDKSVLGHMYDIGTVKNNLKIQIIRGSTDLSNQLFWSLPQQHTIRLHEEQKLSEKVCEILGDTPTLQYARDKQNKKRKQKQSKQTQEDEEDEDDEDDEEDEVDDVDDVDDDY